jgi:hypothetical protein
MKVIVEVPEHWEAPLERIAARMGTRDYSEVFGRALCLAEVVTRHLSEEGAWVELHSPAVGASQLECGVLYGRPGVPVG